MNLRLGFAIVFLFATSLIEAAEPPETLRVASVQMAIADDIETNLARVLRGITEASEAKARLVMFPETALSGFGRETIDQLDWAGLKQAMDAVAASAKQHDLYVLYGCATPSNKSPSGKKRPYNSAVLVGPDGVEITRYHKLGPEPWFEPGDHLTLFEIDGIPCTAMICHDERYPEVVRLPVLSGALVCFYISYEINSMESALRKAEGYRAQLIARAAENGIWVCQANGIGPLGESDAKSLGQSRIVDPGGDVIAEAPALVDTMLVEDIRPSESGRRNALESLDLSPVGNWWREGLKLVKHAGTSKDETARKEPEKNTVRLALMQTVPEKWELDHNFEVFLEMLETASEQKAEIFITPECWLDGYAAPDEVSTPEKLREIAQPLMGSKYLDRVATEARKRSMYICFGFTSLEDGKIYNASGLWDDKGQLVGVYHKTHLQTHDLQYEFGQQLPVWNTPWGPLGIMICADRRWPETTRTLRLKGARLILNPTYGMHHEANEWWMRTRSYENQCFIAFTHPNVGFVVGPKGKVVDKRDEQPGVLICDVDLRLSTDDNHLKDRRPELYQAITELK